MMRWNVASYDCRSDVSYALWGKILSFAALWTLIMREMRLRV